MNIISISEWLRVKWALLPERCSTCGRPRSVQALGEDRRVGWTTWCPTCDDPRNAANAERVRDELGWLVGEILPILAEVRPLHERTRPDVMIWSRPGAPIGADALESVLTSLAFLHRARETYVRKPGEWALELREDGSLWAPWCPIERGWGSPRSGAPLPYKECMLGAARQTRVCIACLTPLAAGDRVWRPYNPGGTLNGAGWAADAHQTACICQACARAVISKGIEVEDGKVFGPLRLVRAVAESDGGRTGPSSA